MLDNLEDAQKRIKHLTLGGHYIDRKSEMKVVEKIFEEFEDEIPEDVRNEAKGELRAWIKEEGWAAWEEIFSKIYDGASIEEAMGDAKDAEDYLLRLCKDVCDEYNLPGELREKLIDEISVREEEKLKTLEKGLHQALSGAKSHRMRWKEIPSTHEISELCQTAMQYEGGKDVVYEQMREGFSRVKSFYGSIDNKYHDKIGEDERMLQEADQLHQVAVDLKKSIEALHKFYLRLDKTVKVARDENLSERNEEAANNLTAVVEWYGRELPGRLEEFIEEKEGKDRQAAKEEQGEGLLTRINPFA